VAQPSFVPVPDADRVRASIPAPIPLKARANRPGELRGPCAPTGRGVGTTGPDQGYALHLAHRLAPSLKVLEGEERHDVSLGVALLGSRRAALAGRAPCAYDLEVAAGLFGYLIDAPQDLVDFRRGLFRGLAHSYEIQRALVDAVPAEALRLTPQAAADVTSWRERLTPREETPT
jgi:hypothetical protein